LRNKGDLMGHHYVPQKYLRGFAEPGNPDAIWMYDKKLRNFTNPGIKSAAQESGFYSAEVEQQLTEFVENPANRVLDKLRDQKSIDDIERFYLAFYIATMFKRVPKARARAYSILASTLEKTIAEVKIEIQERARSTQNKELVDHRIAEIEKAELSLRKRTPDVIVEQIRLPWASKKMIRLVFAMSWCIVRSTGPNYFITSDNPAYFFEAFGLGKPESELTFPIATDLALFASWQGLQNSTSYFEARQRLVREANKRLAGGAERFVFYHQREAWVAKVSDNPKPYLSRIQW
jgi:hypothetical protein